MTGSPALTDWSSLETAVATLTEQQGIADHPDPANGPTNPNVHTRLFGKTEVDIRVKLYRDHAAWCPYCQRVWLLLEEKRIPYTMEKINMRSYGDKPRSFLEKVPGGLLPVIELDGRVITESADIMMILDQTFTEVPMLPPAGPLAGAAAGISHLLRAFSAPLLAKQTTFEENKMLPDDARLREAAKALLQLERDIFALWCRWLFRPLDEAGEARAREAFAAAMQMLDDALARVGGCGPFFLGESISMVDIMIVPFLERQNASLLHWKGFKLRNGGYANIDRWFEALEERSTYSATQSDHYTHCWDIPPQYGTCWPAPNSESFAKAINGTDGDSWHLPLSPLNTTSMEPRSNVDEDGEAEKYRVQAAARLVGNRKNVARFALRAVGSPGKHFSAPLADPHATPGAHFEEHVTAALQCTATALLEGTEAAERAFGRGEWLEGGEGREEAAKAVQASLEYLRDRVGVPRDMQLPAARQLRAHLNWTIGVVQRCT